MEHPLPEPRDFAEQMFMFYAERIMRDQFRSEEERSYCKSNAEMYYHMLINLYSWEDFIRDYDLPLDIIYPKTH